MSDFNVHVDLGAYVSQPVPTITRQDDGTVVMDWPAGLRSAAVPREVLEQFIAEHNELVLLKAATTPTPDPFSDSTPLVCSTDPGEICEACT